MRYGALVLLVAVAPPLHAQETTVTIYQDSRAVVRRTFPAQLARGGNAVDVALGARNPDPGTLVSLDDGVELRGVRIIEATGQEGALRRSVGADLDFLISRPDSAPRYARGRLLSVEPPAVRLDGRVRYAFPGLPVFPDSLVRIAPSVEVSVDAARAQSGLRLMYATEGTSWSASYALVLARPGSGAATVSGTATIRNAGLTLPGARVQLLAGDVRRAVAPRDMAVPMAAAMEMRMAAAPPTEESVGETHVYTLPGTLDLEQGVTRSVALFPRTAVTVETEYTLRGGVGVTAEWPDAQRDLHPEVAYRVRRASGTAFGRTPLPGGVVRVYLPDSASVPQLVGEAAIGHTPAGRDLRAVTGTAFDLTATRVQTAFERRGPRETVSAYRVELQNAKAEPVSIAVEDRFPGQHEILSGSHPAERISANVVRFSVRVPAGGEAVLEYRVRARW